ncbi:MAG: V-type ATP synthase subunit E [Planctomycetota bacterium]|jgi:vacuolar-type H+-ATPase subunit E/Vma4
MDSVEREKAALIAGIEKDARAEQEKIIDEARVQAAEKKKYSERKIESLLAETQTKAQEQAEAAKKKIVSAAEREVKRRSMGIRDIVMQEIMDRVEKKLGSITGDENYRHALIVWLTEAQIGLDAKSARVNASAQERRIIDERMLSEVSRRVRKQTARQVELVLSDAEPLKSQGVVLTADDGRTAFNNQVRTRMLRKKREIQMLIYDTLFADDQKEQL